MVNTLCRKHLTQNIGPFYGFSNWITPNKGKRLPALNTAGKKPKAPSTSLHSSPAKNVELPPTPVGGASPESLVGSVSLCFCRFERMQRMVSDLTLPFETSPCPYPSSNASEKAVECREYIPLNMFWIWQSHPGDCRHLPALGAQRTNPDDERMVE